MIWVHTHKNKKHTQKTKKSTSTSVFFIFLFIPDSHKRIWEGKTQNFCVHVPLSRRNVFAFSDYGRSLSALTQLPGCLTFTTEEVADHGLLPFWLCCHLVWVIALCLLSVSRWRLWTWTNERIHGERVKCNYSAAKRRKSFVENHSNHSFIHVRQC